MLENYIDFITVFYLAICFIAGLRKSLSSAMSEFLSLALAIFLSLRTFSLTANFFENNFHISAGYTNAIGFFVNALILKTILLFIFDILLTQTKTSATQEHNDPFNRFFSGTFSLLYGILTIIVAFSIIFSLSLPQFITSELQNSRFIAITQRDPIKINADMQDIFGKIYETAEKDFNFMSIKTGDESKVDLGFKTLETTIDSQSENAMLELVNQERTSRGLKALKMDSEAQRAARDYGQYLFKNGVFSHTDLEGEGPSDRIKNYKVEYMILGENLAYAPSLDQAHKGLMNSPGHRANILNPFFSNVGIGVIDGGDYGKIFVQEFWG